MEIIVSIGAYLQWAGSYESMCNKKRGRAAQMGIDAEH